MLIKKCKEITFEEPDIMDARLMAMNIRIRGFNIRIINAYSPTNCGGGGGGGGDRAVKGRRSVPKYYRSIPNLTPLSMD